MARESGPSSTPQLCRDGKTVPQPGTGITGSPAFAGDDKPRGIDRPAYLSAYEGDPWAWSIVAGKLYLNYNADVHKTWHKDASANIAKADRNWPKVLEK
jgi:hypothetical protein